VAVTEKQLMDTLHDAVTKDLLMRVQSGEATASELSVAVKFLKDNEITADIVESKPMQGLIDSFLNSEDYADAF
jgi:hypothetical protein